MVNLKNENCWLQRQYISEIVKWHITYRNSHTAYWGCRGATWVEQCAFKRIDTTVCKDVAWTGKFMYIECTVFCLVMCILNEMGHSIIHGANSTSRCKRSCMYLLKPCSQPNARFFDRTFFSLIPIFWNRIRFY